VVRKRFLSWKVSVLLTVPSPSASPYSRKNVSTRFAASAWPTASVTAAALRVRS
jgi:hypothetical protein